tara:strand:+ start:2302 stop:3339 length:1038 start_codon:yes stop_codon:yes gene_type:complete
MGYFSSNIINWYKNCKRDLPWRKTRNPYKIWLSEIILQQTQVKQGLPYYEKFIATFPTVSKLANADEEQVLKLWQGLGYYSRARNLHFAAKQIYEKGYFPNNYKDIISLKGVGEYTAAAIASFAYKLPYAVVDGNVFRLLSRFYGIDIPINTSKGKKHFTELAQTLITKDNPDTFNQSIMEFGSQMCKPKNPNCENCPLQSKCVSYSESTIHLLPVKQGKVKVKTVYFDYFFFKKDTKTLISKRTSKGIWQNLYEFPLIISDKEMKHEDVLIHPQFELWTQDIDTNIISVSEFKHVLSHRIIFARFWQINCNNKLPITKCKEIKIEDIEKFAVSRLMDKFLQSKI